MAYSGKVLDGWHGDGVLCKLDWRGSDRKLVNYLRKLNLPTVDLSPDGAALGYPSFMIDPADIGRRAAEHFLARGLKHFAHLSMDGVPSSAARCAGFASALAELGHEVHDVAAEVGCDSRRGEERLGRRLAALPRPVGLFCAADEHAALAMHACLRAGLRVPEEVAILGVNNQELICENLPVPLSSVAMDMEGLARAACAALDRMMEGKKVPAVVTWLPAQTVVARLSTHHLPTRHGGVGAAAQFIATHFHEAITVDDVAAASGMTRSGLKRAFTRELGRSIHDEIEQVRMLAIRRMLVETDLKLEVVARRAGLSGVRQLHSLFARHERMPPGAWRTATPRQPALAPRRGNSSRRQAQNRDGAAHPIVRK